MFTKGHLKTYQIVAAVLCLVFAIKIILRRKYKIDCLYYVKQHKHVKNLSIPSERRHLYKVQNTQIKSAS